MEDDLAMEREVEQSRLARALTLPPSPEPVAKRQNTLRAAREAAAGKDAVGDKNPTGEGGQGDQEEKEGEGAVKKRPSFGRPAGAAVADSKSTGVFGRGKNKKVQDM